MSASLGKRILKWTILLAPWLLAVMLAAGWGLSAWTPGYLETLVPRLAKEMGLPLEEFHIRNAGLFSANIGPVRLGSENDGLRINNVRVTYSPALLKQGRVSSVQLSGLSLRCAYDGTTFSLPVLDILPKSGGNTDKSIPALPLASLHISESVIQCDLKGTLLSVPFSAEITPGKDLGFTVQLHPRDQLIELAGTLGPTMDDLKLSMSADTIRLGAWNDILPMTMKGDLGLEVSAKVNLADLSSATADVAAIVSGLELPESGIGLDATTPISLEAEIGNQAVDFSLTPVHVTTPQPAVLTLSNAHASAKELRAVFDLQTMGIQLPGQLAALRGENAWKVSFTAENKDKLSLTTGGREIHLGGMQLAIEGKASPSKANITVTGNTRYASLAGVPARTGKVSFALPLAWPAPKRHTPGKLRVTGLRYDKYKVGTLVTKLRQEDMNLALSGALYSQLLPDLVVKLSGSASMKSNDASFRFDVPQYALTDAFDPTTLIPAMEGVKVNGNLAVEGGLDIHDGDIKSRMGAFLTDGTLSIIPESGDEKAGTSVEGIRLYFESPDLLNFRSAPAQFLGFEKLTAGPIEIGKGVVTFQLEPNNVVLVERLGFDWVGGHVASRAFRVVPGHEEYDVTLFCSQLRLSSLLKQLGLAEAKGEAALSGELPVTWKRGKISFHNGFLHSTPGQGGTIQVEAMQDLVSAIPEGTPQRGQLELAQAAIKDFEYKWVRIKADTVGEDLMVQLSVDGKPAGTLPFVYTKEFGGFARVTGDVKGSNFQGLRLDVNFSLPLDRILLYKDIINMIE